MNDAFINSNPYHSTIKSYEYILMFRLFIINAIVNASSGSQEFLI